MFEEDDVKIRIEYQEFFSSCTSKKKKKNYNIYLQLKISFT